MCYECWKEFKGWCKAFTKTEVFLAILETLLLILFISFLIFLIMHILVCSSWISKTDPIPPDQDGGQVTGSGTSGEAVQGSTKSSYWRTTLDPSVKCTWEPSKKTTALTHYYEGDTTPILALMGPNKKAELKVVQSKSLQNVESEGSSRPGVEEPASANVNSLAFDELSDGEEADHEYKSVVLALVKLRPPRDVTFGCVLAVVSDRWTLTAASCVEAVEEVDSLDNFVLMERYGEARRGRTHTIADVQLHPLYQGANRSYDVAALRSEDSLRPAATPLALPMLIDYFLITVGEKFSILGFGSFRTIDQSGAERAVRAVAVYSVPGAACRAADAVDAADAADAWAPRHLSRGGEDAHPAGGCGASSLCAAVRYARGQACTFCAGTPLVRGGVLLGVQAGARACAVACEPAPYVNVAAVRDWLDLVLDPDS